MKRKWLAVLIPLLAAGITFLLFRTVFVVGYVPSESMEPTLKKGDLILGLRLYGELETGDIIIFEHDGELMVKRIAAKGGERVEIDGVRYDVPQGAYFVLGDNADNSYDSRYWEEPFVAASDIVAKLQRRSSN